MEKRGWEMMEEEHERQVITRTGRDAEKSLMWPPTLQGKKDISMISNNNSSKYKIQIQVESTE